MNEDLQWESLNEGMNKDSDHEYEVGDARDEADDR